MTKVSDTCNFETKILVKDFNARAQIKFRWGQVLGCGSAILHRVEVQKGIDSKEEQKFVFFIDENFRCEQERQ